MDHNKFLMESLDEFMNEGTPDRLNQDISNEERLEGIVKGFGINLDEVYYDSLKEGILRMAAEIYGRRGNEYVKSGWVNPN